MELKTLYTDLTVLTEQETPLYAFLLSYDLAVRSLLCRYPKSVLLPDGEYTTAASPEESFPLAEVFVPAVLYLTAGELSGDKTMTAKGEALADKAYLAAWRERVRGKHRRGGGL